MVHPDELKDENGELYADLSVEIIRIKKNDKNSLRLNKESINKRYKRLLKKYPNYLNQYKKYEEEIKKIKSIYGSEWFHLQKKIKC